ncbi:MAG: thioredoxin family protein [Candidatus Thorarchaeota archaeon]
MSEEKKPNITGFDALAKNIEKKLAGSSDNPDANGIVNNLDNDDFMNPIRKSPTSIVMLYRTECPYCKQLTPLLDELAEDFKSKVMFAKINIDNVTTAQDKFDILGVPVVMAFKKGNVVARIEGLRKIEEYESWIDSIHKGLSPMGIDAGPLTQID